jgi:hypothetical protein
MLLNTSSWLKRPHKATITSLLTSRVSASLKQNGLEVRRPLHRGVYPLPCLASRTDHNPPSHQPMRCLVCATLSPSSLIPSAMTFLPCTLLRELSTNSPKPRAPYTHYRCNKYQMALYQGELCSQDHLDTFIIVEIVIIGGIW